MTDQTSDASSPEGSGAKPAPQIPGIDLGTRAHLEPRGMSGRIVASFSGGHADCLIFALRRYTNEERSVYDYLYPDNPIKAVYHQDGSVYGFISRIVRYTPVPFPHIFLGLPDEMESRSLRQSRRIESHLPAYVIHGGAEAPGLIVDVSEGGCRITLLQEDAVRVGNPSSGATLDLQFSLPGSVGGLEARGHVLSVHDSGGIVSLAVSFDKGQQRLNESLGSFISDILIYRGY